MELFSVSVIIINVLISTKKMENQWEKRENRTKKRKRIFKAHRLTESKMYFWWVLPVAQCHNPVTRGI